MNTYETYHTAAVGAPFVPTQSTLPGAQPWREKTP